MTLARINGIDLNYEDTGDGEPVVLVQGTGGGGRAWRLHQVPALTAAGYRAITFDNRGIPPTSECGEGFTVEDMVGDLVGLIEHLALGPCRLVGTSMGAFLVQELAVARPDLVHQAVLMATHGRPDALRVAQARADRALRDSGVELPPAYDAVNLAVQNLSPRTLADPRAVQDWLEIFELTSGRWPGLEAQLALHPIPDRLDAYRGIRVPCRVVAFADDLVLPPHLGREVADAIPGAEFVVIEGCGHFGYLEDPAAVNKALIEYFRSWR